MRRLATFLMFMTFAATGVAQDQRPNSPDAIVPPGPNYDPAKHVNPLITYVQSKDFKPVTYKEAQDGVDFPLLGVSKETGTLDCISLAQPPLDPSKELKIDVRGTFYPVVHQVFKIAQGGQVDLYSFKPPKVQESAFSRMMVGGMPRGRPNAKQKRFGSVPLPEELEVRGRPGLMFEQDGTLTIAWQEDGVIFCATSKLSKDALFDVLDDLL